MNDVSGHNSVVTANDSKMKSTLYCAIALGCVIGGFITTGIFIMYLM